jgi:hypothetical protein
LASVPRTFEDRGANGRSAVLRHGVNAVPDHSALKLFRSVSAPFGLCATIVRGPGRPVCRSEYEPIAVEEPLWATVLGGAAAAPARMSGHLPCVRPMVEEQLPQAASKSRAWLILSYTAGRLLH